MADTLETIPPNLNKIRDIGQGIYEGYIFVSYEEFLKNDFNGMLNAKVSVLTAKGYNPQKLYLKYQIPMRETYIYALKMVKRI